MPGLFQGLELGRRALLTSQASLQTIGHNIANVNTPGYSRQRVNISSTLPENNTLGSFGTGVEVKDIQQIRDLFLGNQYRQESKSLGEWTYKEKILSQVESLFNEPNDNTLSDQMNKFWNAWDDFAKDPGSSSTRNQLVSQTKIMTNSFHELTGQVEKLRQSIDSDLNNYTNQINSMTAEVARLNHQIQSLEIGGVRANDLRDSRDLVLDKLASLVDINTNENQSGEMVVYIGAMSVVNGSDALQVESKVANVDGKPTHQLVWEGTDVQLTNMAGQLKALIDSRDVIIPKYLDKLDTLAATMVEQVNAVHMQGQTANGQTNIAFFDTTKTNARDITINPDILSNQLLVISSASGAESDNNLAYEIAKLRDKNVLNNDSISINGFYNTIIGSVGVEANEASSYATNYDLLVQQIEFAKESVQGVSLDEEMTNMIKYQHAYDAAARVITTMDQALDTIMRMGVVGR